METAALCKYLWCNISMWIDFPPNPSIITGISWKPTSRWWLRALGSSDRSGVSPSHSKYLFFFWLGAAQLWGHFMCQSLRFHSRLTSKPISGPLFLWRGCCTRKCPNRKMWCRSNYSGCVPEKREILMSKTQSPGYSLTPNPLCLLCSLYVQSRAEWKLGNVEGKGCSSNCLAENQCIS